MLQCRKMRWAAHSQKTYAPCPPMYEVAQLLYPWVGTARNRTPSLPNHDTSHRSIHTLFNFIFSEKNRDKPSNPLTNSSSFVLSLPSKLHRIDILGNCQRFSLSTQYLRHGHKFNQLSEKLRKTTTCAKQVAGFELLLRRGLPVIQRILQVAPGKSGLRRVFASNLPPPPTEIFFREELGHPSRDLPIPSAIATGRCHLHPNLIFPMFE
jgi:hypothetical protein